MQTTQAEGTDPSCPTRDTWHSGNPARGRWLLAGLVLATGAGFYALGLDRYLSLDFLRTHLDQLQGQVRHHLVPALVIFFLAYAVATALSLPAATVLTLAAGALFGRWLGTGVVSLASTSGATLAFLGSRYLLRDFTQDRFGERLGTLNRGLERDGAYYLLTLRLVPLVPFFLVNLGMGLTRIPLRTYVGVSLLGMLPGTFLYVNAGTALAAIDSPKDVLSPLVLTSLTLLGLGPLLLRQVLRWKVRLRTVGMAALALLLVAVAGVLVRTKVRYATAEAMQVPIREYTNAEYPEDPANHSIHFGQFDGRRLTVAQRDETHFEFILEPTDAGTAKVVIRDVDVSLMTPGVPEWAREDGDLTRIALTDRQWNRQQVSFGRDPAHVEVTGGNGFERKHLVSAELAKNCLNAGLWEVLLFVEEDGQKALYYQNWFTFPLGHYKTLFERNTGLPYGKHWYYLEHWFDPDGTPVRLESLRRVTAEREVPITFDPGEAILASGEQVRKRRTVIADNLRTWGDFYDGRKVRFATFIPPGRYSVGHPWKNAYGRMDRLEKAMLREVDSAAANGIRLQELELVFGSTHGEGKVRFLVSGFDLEKLPRLAPADYAQTATTTAKARGEPAYMPMGIGTPPFFQDYEALRQAPPQKSPYFSMTLDENDRWVNHHDLAIDGPVLHVDDQAPNLLHFYLLSYERHTLIGHFSIETRK